MTGATGKFDFFQVPAPDTIPINVPADIHRNPRAVAPRVYCVRFPGVSCIGLPSPVLSGCIVPAWYGRLRWTDFGYRKRANTASSGTSQSPTPGQWPPKRVLHLQSALSTRVVQQE